MYSACAGCVQTYLADVGDVRALAHKGRCNEVNVIGQSPLDQILLIFLCQGRQIHDDSWQVDVLAFPARHEPCDSQVNEVAS